MLFSQEVLYRITYGQCLQEFREDEVARSKQYSFRWSNN